MAENSIVDSRATNVTPLLLDILPACIYDSYVSCESPKAG